jgi:hypothetical protein
MKSKRVPRLLLPAPFDPDLGGIQYVIHHRGIDWVSWNDYRILQSRYDDIRKAYKILNESGPHLDKLREEARKPLKVRRIR